jgi:hypothetical protein
MIINKLTSCDISVLLCAISKARDYYAPDKEFLGDLADVERKVRGAEMTPEDDFNPGSDKDLEF